MLILHCFSFMHSYYIFYVSCFLPFTPRVKDICGFNIQLPPNSHLCPEPMFCQIAAEFEAIEMKRIFTLRYIKLIFRGRVLHLASF